MTMACCAFALYLLTQLLLPMRWLRDRLFGVPAPVASAAVGWSPGVVAARASRPRWRLLVLTVMAVEVAGVSVALASPAAAVADDAAILAQLHRSLCAAVTGEPS